jgi:tetratricopeptide (TPR) repeat protein
VAFARDSLEDALAEYRLSIRQGSSDPTVLARTAHAYVALDQVDEAASWYARAAESDPRWADMGVADLVRVAREAALSDDFFQMASAMEAARRLRPGVSAPDLTLLLARHYFSTGEYGRALPHYLRAEIESGGGSPDIARERGEAQWRIGDCRGALLSFERYRMLASQNQAAADWYIGTCSLQLANELRTRPGDDPSDLEEALGLVNRAIEVGEPQQARGQVWFERGEILSAMGDCDGALQAFGQVRLYESARSSRLILDADRRIDRVRIGRDLVTLQGNCG